MISTDPYVCKLCGRQSTETKLSCDNDDFCMCMQGYGCQKEFGEENIFRNIYKSVIESKQECFPRGLRIKEIENFSCVFPPFVRFVNFEDRNLKINYIKKEFLWYLKGDKFDISIVEHAKMWKEFINEDGSINSNYGQYLFGDFNQFYYVLDCLLKDKDSRRAIVMILQPYHLLDPTMKEVPCTYGIGFRIRNNELNMSVKMRSQDSWFGFGSDIPCFSFIHEMLYMLLKDKYVGLKIGSYYHSVDSFHVYEQHFDLVKKISQKNSKFSFVDCPRISSSVEVRFLTSRYFLFSEGKVEIPKQYKFAQWLVS
jgi:thymidylate synthase